ncbi:APL1A [Chlorella sorokiniana]|uniref:APL1A n=1 Tax=Chlorella sorokiniana TaxID=3076 RepID=A0A2P6TH27_CHLSO|nr:APL1A [Chlorella sorokiniana]|eukprot:PRW33599.1 APL1A [Chlorella sorokiniana]
MSGGSQTATISHLPDELLSRVLAAAAAKETDGSIDLRRASALPSVCKRWRGLCFDSNDLWQALVLEMPRVEAYTGERQRWLRRKRWLLQRLGPLVRDLCITSNCADHGMVEALLRAALCTLRSLALCMLWGRHVCGVLPQLLALARGRFQALAALEITTSNRKWHLGDQVQLAALQVETNFSRDVVTQVAALGSSLTSLTMQLSRTSLPALAPLRALSGLRQLALHSFDTDAKLQPPPLEWFPCLEQFAFESWSDVEVAGSSFAAARWHAEPQHTLYLLELHCAELAPLLAALQPPAAGPLEHLRLEGPITFAGDAAAVAADLAAAAPRLAAVRALEVSNAQALAPVLQLLLQRLPCLEALVLDRCGLASLPKGEYLSGLQHLSLRRNQLERLPPAVFQATRLLYLELSSNGGLGASLEELQRLLRTMPRLQLLDWQGTGLALKTAQALSAAAAAVRGLTLKLPEFELPDGSVQFPQAEPLVSLAEWLEEAGGSSWSIARPDDDSDGWVPEGDW